nr:hypothetical protein [Escherichia coli]
MVSMLSPLPLLLLVKLSMRITADVPLCRRVPAIIIVLEPELECQILQQMSHLHQYRKH